MSQLSLTKTQLINGTWQAELIGAGSQPPALSVTHLGEPLDGLRLTHNPADDTWRIEVPVPVNLINDGLQTFVISDKSGKTLGSFALLAGEALADDIRAEVDLLRAELEMLKHAFRQHCRDS